MKRSGQVTLTVLAAMALAACNRQPDPCDASSFEPDACRSAVQGGGYYSHGTWVSRHYANSYPYYYNNYNRYVSRSGGSAHSSTAGSHGVSRGGFGSTGSGHASGG